MCVCVCAQWDADDDVELSQATCRMLQRKTSIAGVSYGKDEEERRAYVALNSSVKAHLQFCHDCWLTRPKSCLWWPKRGFVG